MRCRQAQALGLLAAWLASFGLGCGTTRWSDTPRTATEQLLLSDAIDQAVNRLDFGALAGKEVYFEPKYLQGTVDEAYVVSSIRQHLLASGCLLKSSQDEAQYVVEARAGAVGTDRNEFSLGSPSIPMVAPIPGVPALPAKLPEVTLAKKTKQRAVAKLAVFAYERKTGRPVWQSGSAPMVSYAGDAWFLGAGPFQRGDIHEGTSLAGEKLPLAIGGEEAGSSSEPQIDTRDEFTFVNPDRATTYGPPVAPAANSSAGLAARGEGGGETSSASPADSGAGSPLGEPSDPQGPHGPSPDGARPLRRAQQDHSWPRRWFGR